MNKHLKCVLKMIGAILLISLFFLPVILTMFILTLLYPVFDVSGCFKRYNYPSDMLASFIIDCLGYFRNL